MPSKIISPAPIFDNGLSRFNYVMDNDIKDLDSYAKTRSNPNYKLFGLLMFLQRH